MPRSYQAYPQNAVVTHSPAQTSSTDPNQALKDGKSAFQVPSFLDACAGITNGTANPFISGLNTLGQGSGSSTNTPGQTGNILSGFQQFADSLCGFALGGTGVGDVLAAARKLREQGADLHETLDAIRSSDLYQRLRGTVVHGTTPQTVLAGVGAVTDITGTNAAVQGAIATGQQTAGISGNQIVDAVNGSQAMANQGSQLLTGDETTDASGGTLLTAGGQAINQNTANHAANYSLTTAQSVSLKQQNLLVSQDFHSSYAVVGNNHWSWDGTDGAPSTDAAGCAKCLCDGTQAPLLSSEIPVVAGETIEVSAEVKWSGLTYSGSSPIILGVEKYRQMKDPNGSGKDTYSDIGWYPVYTVPSPGLSSTSTANNWIGIAGTYTVEPGVDQLRFRLEVDKNATAGTVKWDDAEFLKLDLIPAEAVPGVTDNIVTQLYGSAGSGFTANDAATALANTRNSITSVASEVAALQAEGHTGAVAGDDFSWSGALLGNANWLTTYSNTGFGGPQGSYSASGGDAVFTPDNGQPQDCMFIWRGTDSTSTTDYQLIQLVLDSSPQTVGKETSFISLRGRISTDGTNFADAAIGSDGSYHFGYWSGGTFNSWSTGTCAVPGAGSAVSLFCGDKTNTLPRRYTLQIGSTIVATFDDPGVGPLGTGNRGWGWGAEADGYWTSTGQPPAINQWLAMDQ